MQTSGYFAICIACEILIVLLPALRFFILRKRDRRRSDIISDIFLALACTASFSMEVVVLRQLGLEIRYEREYPMDVVNAIVFESGYRRTLFIMSVFYKTILWLFKGAFIAFYWGLFMRADQKFRWVLYVVAVVTACMWVAVFVAHLAWCRPIWRNWTNDLADFERCAELNSLTTTTLSSFANIFTDLLILVLPLLILRSLRLSRPEAYALPFVFFVGILSILAATTRYVILYFGISDSTETTMSLREGIHLTQIWSTIEVVTACTAFCMPSFRLFSRRFRKSEVSRERGSSAGEAGQRREPWENWEMGTIGVVAALESRERLRMA